jgi:hypothetical protein
MAVQHTSSKQVVSFQDAVAHGVIAAFAAEDYLDDRGEKDYVKVRQAAYDVLADVKVIKKVDRLTVPITQGNLTRKVFPNLVHPGAFEDQPDPDVAAAVWEKVKGLLWTQVNAAPGSNMQNLVGRNMGNGYVLCRTKASTSDGTPAAYITDNFEAIKLDFQSPAYASARQKVEQALAVSMLLIDRQPQHAKAWKSFSDAQLKSAKELGHTRLTGAIEASKAAADNGDDDNGDNGGNGAEAEAEAVDQG